MTRAADRTSPFLRARSGGALLRLAELVAMPIAVHAGQQAGTATIASEVPGLEALTVVGARGGHDLRGISGDQHVAAAAGGRAFHRYVGQLFVFHGSSHLSPSPAKCPRISKWRKASVMPERSAGFSTASGSNARGGEGN